MPTINIKEKILIKEPSIVQDINRLPRDKIQMPERIGKKINKSKVFTPRTLLDV